MSISTKECVKDIRYMVLDRLDDTEEVTRAKWERGGGGVRVESGCPQ